MPSTSIMTRGVRTIIKQAYAGHRLTLWLLIGVISILSVGCPTAVQYQPNEGIVDTLGVVPARQRLQEIVARSINPQVTESEVTDDFLQYRFRQAVAGFRTAGDIALAQFIFGNHQDAKMFADLLTSFRAQRARGSSGTR